MQLRDEVHDLPREIEAGRLRQRNVALDRFVQQVGQAQAFDMVRDHAQRGADALDAPHH
jgi:hypothetical protein